MNSTKFYNERIEAGYLCCLITNPGTQKESMQNITEYDFYVAATKAIYSACREQMGRDGVIESITLWEFVDKSFVDFEYYQDILKAANDPDIFGVLYKKKLKELSGQRKIQESIVSASINLEGGNVDQAMEDIKSIKDTRLPVIIQDETVLYQRIEQVASGERCTVGWPWPLIDSLTESLQPGAMTILCGGVGASKSFMLLQALRYWISQEVPCKCLMMEEDKAFHLRRALAQSTGNPWITRDREMYSRIDEARELYRENIIEMKCVSKSIDVNKRMTQTKVRQWIELEAIHGSRIICVDPITAADQEGVKPWESDKRFISEVEDIAVQHGASILFVNHPVKGQNVEPSTSSMAGGAAWERFVPTILWLEYHDMKTKQVKNSLDYGPMDLEFNRTIHLSKTRYGPGQGLSLAAKFENLNMTVEGVIVKGKRKNED
jgi:replicative DNA helicase